MKSAVIDGRSYTCVSLSQQNAPLKNTPLKATHYIIV